MIREWNSFAKSIRGVVQASKATHFNKDNHYKITTDDSEVELTWGNQSQKGRGPYVTLESKLRFSLKNNTLVSLKVRPKDLLTRFFSFKAQKFGVKELDAAYSFSSNSEGLVFKVTHIFQDFHKHNECNNFIVETELINNIPTLTIYFPELLTTESKLAFYYNFGYKISKRLSVET
jgi:hypothetical protein